MNMLLCFGWTELKLSVSSLLVSHFSRLQDFLKTLCFLMCGMIFMSSDPLIKVRQEASVSLPETPPDSYLCIYFKAPSKLTLILGD